MCAYSIVARYRAPRAEGERGVAGWDLWQRLLPRLDPDTQMRTRMVMGIGTLDVLEDLGRVATRRRDDGVLAFRPTRVA
jgi:hypothetical protein